MIIVADTTPLISLMKVGRLGLIHDLFGEILIPNAVYEELTGNPRFLEESKQIQQSQFIKRTKIEDARAVDLLKRSSGLDAGESEAIVLSDSMKASLLLMDEMKGRRVARRMGINLMGTIGILTIAYKTELMTRADVLNCIEILKIEGRHISNELYEQLIQKISE